MEKGHTNENETPKPIHTILCNNFVKYSSKLVKEFEEDLGFIYGDEVTVNSRVSNETLFILKMLGDQEILEIERDIAIDQGLNGEDVVARRMNELREARNTSEKLNTATVDITVSFGVNIRETEIVQRLSKLTDNLCEQAQLLTGSIDLKRTLIQDRDSNDFINITKTPLSIEDIVFKEIVQEMASANDTDLSLRILLVINFKSRGK